MRCYVTQSWATSLVAWVCAATLYPKKICSPFKSPFGDSCCEISQEDFRLTLFQLLILRRKSPLFQPRIDRPWSKRWSLMTFCPSAVFKSECLEALARWKNRLTDDDLQRPCYDDYDIISLEFSSCVTLHLCKGKDKYITLIVFFIGFRFISFQC